MRAPGEAHRKLALIEVDVRVVAHIGADRVEPFRQTPQHDHFPDVVSEADRAVRLRQGFAELQAVEFADGAVD